MPLQNPVLFWFLVGLVSLCCGLAGGVGGRWLRTKLMIEQVWDELAVMDKRISRREGQASGEARAAKQSAPVPVDPRAVADLKRLLGLSPMAAVPGGGGDDEQSILQRAFPAVKKQ